MIKNHEQFKIPDENKSKELILEVNWNPRDTKTNDCKFIKAIFPNGDTSLIRKEHLNAVLFAIGTEEEQRKMIPQTTIHSRWYETVVSVKAKKDIQKGDAITFPIKLSLPSLHEQAIAGIRKDILDSGVRKF